MKIAIYTISIIILAAFQTTWAHYISVFGATPNIILAFIVCAALIDPPVYSGVTGLCSGIVFDLISDYRFGYNSLTLMYIAIAVSLLKSKFFVPGSVVSAILTFFASLIHGTLFYFFFVYIWRDASFFGPLVTQILPNCIYTAVIAFCIFPLFKKSLKHRV